MKRARILVGVLVAVLLALVGCSSDAKDSADSTAAQGQFTDSQSIMGTITAVTDSSVTLTAMMGGNQGLQPQGTGNRPEGTAGAMPEGTPGALPEGTAGIKPEGTANPQPEQTGKMPQGTPDPDSTGAPGGFNGGSTEPVTYTIDSKTEILRQSDEGSEQVAASISDLTVGTFISVTLREDDNTVADTIVIMNGTLEPSQTASAD